MAICDEAHRLDLPVTAHAQGAGQVERALGAGFDELAHTPWIRLSDDVIETAAARLRIVSTLDIHSYGRDTPEIRAAIDNLRRFHAAGGTVIYGTDLGNGPDPGRHPHARGAAAPRCRARAGGDPARDGPRTARPRRPGRSDRAGPEPARRSDRVRRPAPGRARRPGRLHAVSVGCPRSVDAVHRSMTADRTRR